MFFGLFNSFSTTKQYEFDTTLINSYFRDPEKVFYDDFFEGKFLIRTGSFDTIIETQKIDTWSNMYKTDGIVSNSREIRFEEKEKSRLRGKRKTKILLKVDNQGHFKTLQWKLN